jgi:hypothetical protein
MHTWQVEGSSRLAADQQVEQKQNTPTSAHLSAHPPAAGTPPTPCLRSCLRLLLSICRSSVLWCPGRASHTQGCPLKGWLSSG